MRKTIFTILMLLLGSSARGQVSGAGQLGCPGTPVTGTVANSGTANNTVLYTTPYLVGNQLIVTLDQTTTLTGGAVTFQEDSGDGNFITLDSWRLVDPTTAPFATIGNPYSVQASTNKQFMILASGLARIQLKLTTAITGTGSVTPFFQLDCYQLPLAYQAANANLNVSATFPSAQPVSQGTAAAATAGWPVVGGSLAEVTAAWTSATGVNTSLTETITGYNSVEVFFNQTTTLTGGVATFEGSDTTGFTNAYPVACVTTNTDVASTTYTFAPSTNQAFDCDVSAFVAFRVRLSTVITGTGTVNVGITANAAAAVPDVAVFQSTSPWVDNLTQVAGTALGATAVVNFGATPAASAVPAVNANVFNAGAAITAAAPLPEQLSQGNAALSATNGIYTNLLQGNAVLSATNPIFERPTDGTNAMGLMANFGTAPGAVTSLNVNANIFSAGAAITSAAPLNTQDAADASSSVGAAANKSLLIGCDFNNTLPTLQNGQQVAVQCDAFGRLLISPQTTSTSGPTGPISRTAITGLFGRTVTSTGDALDVNIKYPQSLAIQPVGNGSVLSNQQAVTATATALPANATKGICVKALIGNTISVYLGPSTVTTATGMEISPGQTVCLPVVNSSLLYLVATTTGASVSWIATN